MGNLHTRKTPQILYVNHISWFSRRWLWLFDFGNGDERSCFIMRDAVTIMINTDTMLKQFDKILTYTILGPPLLFSLGITSHPSNCWRIDLKIIGEVKSRVPIHERAMTLVILFLPMRRLNGRKTQSCRSIAINDRVTALSRLQAKPLGTRTAQTGSALTGISQRRITVKASRAGKFSRELKIPFTARLQNK